VLGPEQINFAPRPNPMFLEGAAAVRITEQVAKSMGLRDNQIIRGVIEERGGILKLMLNNREFDWQGSKKFKHGDKVDFRVEGSLHGRILQPLAPSNAAPSISTPFLGASIPSASSRLLSLLYRPDQASILSQLFKPATLDAFLSRALSESSGLKIEQLIFSISKLSPQMIRSALTNSGLFGEFFLGNQLNPRTDIKQLLRNLIKTMVLQRSDIISLDKAIDEIESRQLEGIQAQQNREVSYHFVIPFYDSEPVEAHFERGPGDFSKGETDWVINLHTESAELGEIWTKTTVKATSDIEMIVWALEHEAIVAVQQGRYQLEGGLDNFGLTLTKFSVLHAQRPLLDPSLTGPGQVLDVMT
jgi:hypothetical protein